MGSEKKCSSCGKMVILLCAACWRCKDCEMGCSCHMQRKVDGVNKIKKDSFLKNLSRK